MSNDVPDKKAAIIEASLRLFTERGFHGTPTAMISQEAGVSTGTLFRYYPTKEDLISGTYMLAKQRLAAAIALGLDEEKTCRGMCRRIWGNMIRWGLENPREFLFIDQFNHSPFISRITEEEAMKSYEFLGALLDEGVASGEMKDIHRGLIIDLLYHANTAVVKKIMHYGLQKDVDTLIEQSFSIVWSGISQ